MLYQNYESLDVVQKIGRRVLEKSGILRLNQELYEYNEHAFVDSCEPSKILNEKEIITLENTDPKYLMYDETLHDVMELVDDESDFYMGNAVKFTAQERQWQKWLADEGSFQIGVMRGTVVGQCWRFTSNLELASDNRDAGWCTIWAQMIVVPNYIEADCIVLKTDESWDEKQLLKFDEEGFQKLEKELNLFALKG